MRGAALSPALRLRRRHGRRLSLAVPGRTGVGARRPLDRRAARRRRRHAARRARLHRVLGARARRSRTTAAACCTRRGLSGPSGAGWRFRIAADRFLHHMVRMLVGTMVDIGLGRRPLEDMARLLAARTMTRRAARARRGLVLRGSRLRGRLVCTGESRWYERVVVVKHAVRLRAALAVPGLAATLVLVGCGDERRRCCRRHGCGPARARGRQIDASRRTAIVTATEKVRPAVVSISVQSRERVQASSPFDFFFVPQKRERTVQGFGTGFILRADGIDDHQSARRRQRRRRSS